MAEITEQDLRNYAEEAERTKNDPEPADAPSASRPGLARSKVLQVRLNPGEYDTLQRHAEERELPVSTIVRGWILARLDGESQGALPGAVDQLVQDVDRIRRLVS